MQLGTNIEKTNGNNSNGIKKLHHCSITRLLLILLHNFLLFWYCEQMVTLFR